ncbi:unnamed protein product [Urochloa decumbens]|uniref:DUF6598 domain-containing protein n=1 Tax=Urochloa decumbens TaxID=240449 RepID=A0ABC9FBA3_9POAL
MSARRWETTDDEEEEWETDDEEDESETEDETPRTTARVEVEKEEGALRTEEQKEDVIRMHESSWMTVSQYRREWDEMWSTFSGSFEDTTRIPPMRFTDKPEPGELPIATLQLFSMKLAATTGGFQLPIDVFGMVAMRDAIDHNRNIVFQRTRDDCQTLTIEDPYFILTGPTRAVMLIESDPVIIEVDLKVKGATESDDECLGFLVKPVVCFGMMYSHLLNYAYTCNHSTLELKLGHIISSVEATIFVRVKHGSWPDGLRGVFAASTTGIYDKYTAGVFLDKRVISIGHERIVLLDFRGERLPVAGDGEVKLSRRVVSVETSGKVIVRAKALGGDKGAVEVESSFEPLEAGSSVGVLEFSFCKMEVTVFWSLISEYP